MPVEELLDLQIFVYREDDENYVRLNVVGSDLSAGPFPFASPLDEDALEELRWYTERYARRPIGPGIERAARVQARMESLGRSLFHAVFNSPGDKQRLAQELWRQFGLVDLPRVVSLVSGLPGVLNLPWELLADDRGYLFDQGVDVRRRLPEVQAADLRSFALPLHVLLVAPRPEDAPGACLASPPEGDALESDAVSVEFLYPPTFDALAQRLEQGPEIHVVHFDGAGTLVGGPGRLYFEDAEELAEEVTPLRLAPLLVRHGVPLFVIDACRAAPAGAPDPYHDVAWHLVRLGLGSVLVLPYGVPVATRERFFANVYRALVAGGSVGESAIVGRQTLHVATFRDIFRRPDGSSRPLFLQDWFVPALYQPGFDPAPFAGEGAPEGEGGPVTRLDYVKALRRGERLLAQGRPNGAARAFRTLLQEMDRSMAYAGVEATCDRALALYKLGRALLAQRTPDAAREATELSHEALKHAESLGDRVLAAKIAHQLGQISASLGYLPDAERWYRRAVADLEATDQRPEVGLAYANLADLLLTVLTMPELADDPLFEDRDVPAEAERWAHKARALLETLDDPSTELWVVYRILAQLAEGRGKGREAAEWWQKEREAFVAFPGNWARLAPDWGWVVDAVAAAAHGAAAARRTVEAAFEAMESSNWRVSEPFRRIWAGERDWNALVQQLDRASALIVLKALEAVEAGPQDRPGAPPEQEAPAAQQVMQRMAPLLVGVVSCCEGDPYPRAAVEQALANMVDQPDWRALAAALRRILAGERDFAALRAGLDPIDLSLVSLTLDVLAGKPEARKQLAGLAEAAQIAASPEAAEQAQAAIDAFEVWQESPAGRAAREEVEALGLEGQAAFNALLQRFIRTQGSEEV